MSDAKTKTKATGTADLFTASAPARADVAQGEEAERRRSQRGQILELLRKRGAAGVRNVELNEIGFRYGGRIFELRRMGYAIETIAEGGGVFRFVLHASGARDARPTMAKNGTAETPTWIMRGECSAACRCFCHTFMGPGGVPCISCP